MQKVSVTTEKVLGMLIRRVCLVITVSMIHVSFMVKVMYMVQHKRCWYLSYQYAAKTPISLHGLARAFTACIPPKRQQQMKTPEVPKFRLGQGTKIFQYSTCPAGRVTYNFHSSCKHMHLSFKSLMQ